MATSWKSQQDNGEYALQFETDCKEKYKVVEKAAQMAVDGKTTADVVEVVRCGQCKCWKSKRKGVLGEYIGDCHNVDFPFHCEFRPVMRESDFCSYGEKK